MVRPIHQIYTDIVNQLNRADDSWAGHIRKSKLMGRDTDNIEKRREEVRQDAHLLDEVAATLRDVLPTQYAGGTRYQRFDNLSTRNRQKLLRKVQRDLAGWEPNIMVDKKYVRELKSAVNEAVAGKEPVYEVVDKPAAAYMGEVWAAKRGRGENPGYDPSIRMAAVKGRDRFRDLEKTAREEGRKYAVAASIIGIVGGLFFLSANITGNAIGNMTNSTSNIIGVVLLVIGIIGGYFWVEGKK